MDCMDGVSYCSYAWWCLLSLYCGVVVGVVMPLLHGVVVGKKNLALNSQLWSLWEFVWIIKL